MIARTLFALLLLIAGLLAPVAASGPLPTLSETRVWAPAISDQTLDHGERLLSQELHRSNAPPAVGCASGDSVSPARTNFNQYENLAEVPISGTSRSAHRASANRNLANQLDESPEMRQMLDGELDQDTLQHMRGGAGGRLRNPPGTEWHHPVDNPDAMHLLRRPEHRSQNLQDVLHPGPGGQGGYGQHYGGGG